MIPAPPGLKVCIVHKSDHEKDEWLDVASFTEDGQPLVVDYFACKLVTPDQVMGVDMWWLDHRPESTPVSAEPGWYVLSLLHTSDSTKTERYPVVAWHTTTENGGWTLGEKFGPSAAIVAPDGSGRPTLLDAADYFGHQPHIEPLGFHHAEWLPEPADLAEQVQTCRNLHLNMFAMNAGANDPTKEK